jgi:hypothetical protein
LGAGSQWAATGEIDAEHLETLRRPIVPVSTFVVMANMSWNIPGEIPPTAQQVQDGKSYHPAFASMPVMQAAETSSMLSSSCERQKP